MINFNEPVYTEKGIKNIEEAIIKYRRINGDGHFTKYCSDWMINRFGVDKILLTTSCTHALEMAALLTEVKKGDEVIMPSYTFASTADAFAIRGCRIKFVDIRPDTMNIDETLIEKAITSKTRAIIPVHYAGVACEMDTIMDIAKRNNLFVIEDAAQGIMATYNGKYLGTIGDFGAYSFHETKNYTMGEGGAFFINNKSYTLRSEIIREKGTNRAQFFRGEIDKYSWVDVGSSYLPSELNAAYLAAQLDEADAINNYRLNVWNTYYNGLSNLASSGKIELPHIPPECVHNAHMFYLKVKDLEQRTDFIAYLHNHGIYATFHYVPLHSSIAGRKYGEFVGKDKFTTSESEKLVRLPLFYGINASDVEYIIETINKYFANV